MEENEYQPDKSGLVSLGGFSYQIKVFADGIAGPLTIDKLKTM